MSKTIVILIALGASAGIFFAYTKPTYDGTKTVQAEIAKYDAALDKSREMQDLKRSLLSRYNTFTTEQLNRLTHLLPDHVDNVRLVLDLDNMANRYGMVVQNVSAERPATLDPALAQGVIGSLADQAVKTDSITMQFSTRGTYANFVSFMKDLERSLRILDVLSLSIDPEPTADSGASAEPIYRFSITLKTYWLK